MAIKVSLQLSGAAGSQQDTAATCSEQRSPPCSPSSKDVAKLLKRAAPVDLGGGPSACVTHAEYHVRLWAWGLAFWCCVCLGAFPDVRK